MSSGPRPAELWSTYLDEATRTRLATGGFGRRVGFGRHPALVVIDVQRYMIGDATLGSEELATYPSSCQEAGRAALSNIVALCDTFRVNKLPVILTKFVLASDGSDAGIYRYKRELLDIDGWCLEGTSGAELVAELKQQATDFVIRKTRPSAFWGTSLLAFLIEHGVDDLVIVGGSTSNCVRATTVDAAAVNLRVQVCADAVFDRVPVSHAISLFDLDRQYADVVMTEEVLSWLKTP